MMDFSKKRFLVIDDQATARDALRTIAQNMGAFSVEFSNSYQDAIFRIRNSVPDIIICDYMLGDGRTGQQLLEELRRFNLLPDDTAFIMVTGEQSYEQVVSAVELIPDDYLIKPFAPEKLMLRLERIVSKKAFFASYYAEKRKQEYERALAVLQIKVRSEAGRPYRFEILRQIAETQLEAGMSPEAETTYRGIVDNAPFPWARAGMARALYQQHKISEARAEIDLVVTQTPYFFDAADLKAHICMAQGEHAEAQKILTEIAAKTPRNFLRKRLLAEAAMHNGDTQTANTLLAEVINGDSMPGAVTLQDRLALARTQIDADNRDGAQKTLEAIPAKDRKDFALAEQASYYALLTLAAPEAGKEQFSSLRRALSDAKLPSQSHIDVLRAALVTGDLELADRHTGLLMGSTDAKKAFNTLRNQYVMHGREKDFREIQRRVAMERIHH